MTRRPIIVLPLVGLLALLGVNQSQAQTPQLYLLQPVDRPLRQSSLHHPRVDGVSIRISWRVLEPRPGEYDFALLDQLLQPIETAEKKWTLRVMAGTNAPAWLPGPKFTYPEGTTTQTVPLPWNGEHQKAYRQLIQALAQRYETNLHLTLVHVPGFGESAEMHLPRGLHYEPAQIVAAWRERIDATATAFSTRPLVLNHSPERHSPERARWSEKSEQRWWSDEVVTYHQHLGRERAYFQMNALAAKTNTDWKGYRTLEELAEQGWTVGFQMLSPAVNRLRFGGPLSEAINKGTAAQASYYELYQTDLEQWPPN